MVVGVESGGNLVVVVVGLVDLPISELCPIDGKSADLELVLGDFFSQSNGVVVILDPLLEVDLGVVVQVLARIRVVIRLGDIELRESAGGMALL